MELITALFNGVFGFITDNKILGVPILYILIGMAVLGLVMSFLVGKK